MIKNKIGLEAEFLLRNKKGDLVFPGDHGFPTDDFVILGEIRGDPGDCVEDTVSNFLKEWHRIRIKSSLQGLKIDLSGTAELPAGIYFKTIKKSGGKNLPDCQNIYGLDINKYSDDVRKNGKLISHAISCGLHIHFSSGETKQVTHEEFKIKEIKVKDLVLGSVLVGRVSLGNLLKPLYEKTGETRTITTELTVSRITYPVILNFVEFLDDQLLTKFQPKTKLKYRQPGYYEVKPDGRFEYRSLPFNWAVLSEIESITNTAFKLLDSLTIPTGNPD